MNSEYVALGAVPMTRGSVLRIEDGRGLLIHVWEGALWLTLEGERRDRYVAPGGYFRLDRGGVALAQALSRSIVTLTAPAPELHSTAKDFWTRLFAPHARPTTAAL
jgi:hypothetical protein